jgi:hypothetical protein
MLAFAGIPSGYVEARNPGAAAGQALATIQTLSTSAVAPRDRLAYWNEAAVKRTLTFFGPWRPAIFRG